MVTGRGQERAHHGAVLIVGPLGGGGVLAERGVAALIETLESRGWRSTRAASVKEAIADVGAAEVVAVVVVAAPGARLGTIARDCAALAAVRPLLLASDVIGTTAAGQALRAGVRHLATGFDAGDRAEQIAGAVARIARAEVIRAALARPLAPGDDGLLGSSPAMHRLRELVDRVGESDAPVLVTGETGSGKDAVARAIHRRSARRGGPLVVVSCAALAESLLESELFGHGRGAFTGAVRARRGLFLAAHRGTLVLDEVASLSPALQAKLLRVLSEHAVRPLGGGPLERFDVRIVALTHADLEAAITRGAFRQDLYFRLRVLHVEVPPLRCRGLDVIELARSFVRVAATEAGKEVVGLTAEAAAGLLDHGFPGNVRELLGAMRAAVARARFDHLVPDDVRLVRSAAIEPAGPQELVPLDVLELAHIARVMRAAEGNVSRAADILGIDRKTLARKLRKHGLRHHGGADRPTRRMSPGAP